MIVRVLSKLKFDEILPRMRINNDNVFKHKDMAFISILNADSKSYFANDHDNVLRLVFDDATDEENERRIKKGLNELQLISNHQVETIINFVEKNKHVDYFYVHCAAGQSRSGAVGVFINDLYGDETYFEFANNNPTIKPNYYILSLLRRKYNNYEE